MRLLTVLALLVAGPAAAQSFRAADQGRAIQLYRINVAASTGVNSFDSSTRPESNERSIRRAGAWGRCVAAASPDLSVAYVRTRVADSALKPVFRSCRRRTGDFAGAGMASIRLAAVADALTAR